MSDIQPVYGGLARGLQHARRVSRYRRTGASPRPRTPDHVHTPPCIRPRARTGARERTSTYPSIRAHIHAHTNTRGRPNTRALSGRTGVERADRRKQGGMGVRGRAREGPAGSFNPSSDLPTIGAQIILTVLKPRSLNVINGFSLQNPRSPNVVDSSRTADYGLRTRV